MIDKFNNPLSETNRAEQKAIQRKKDEEDIRLGYATAVEVNKRNALFGNLSVVKYHISLPKKSKPFEK